jgi:hypothetical protein
MAFERTLPGRGAQGDEQLNAFATSHRYSKELSLCIQKGVAFISYSRNSGST